MPKRKEAAASLAVPVAPKLSLKNLVFVGSARSDLAKMPVRVKKEAGTELLNVQYGHDPAIDFKPMPAVGGGVFELIVNDKDGWYRVFYVAKFEEAVYVLHAFQKKTNKTAQADIDKGKERYQHVVKSRKQI